MTIFICCQCAALEQKLRRLSEDLSCQRQNADSARCSLEQKIKEKEKEFQEVSKVNGFTRSLPGRLLLGISQFHHLKRRDVCGHLGCSVREERLCEEKVPLFSFTLPSFGFLWEKGLANQHVPFHPCPLICLRFNTKWERIISRLSNTLSCEGSCILFSTCF